jgi:hypothetical protein
VSSRGRCIEQGCLLPSRARAVAWAATAAAAATLLARVGPDVAGKPLFEDEAVAGLIGARPVAEIVVTTLWDRGGAPLHFLLAHLAFVFDPSPEALRWLSVVFALAAVVVSYDLGRRLAGRVGGVVTATVVAASGMLAVYGSFGRMYALLAFAGALAADLFVRALDERTTAAAAWAAAAAWLLPAVHPYGGIVVALEALVALALWRGRPLRPAIPVAAVGLLLVPFVVADLRLAGRFEVSSEASGRLATREEAWSQLTDALRGFAGGEGVFLVVFLVLAGAGAVVLARREPAFVAWGLVALAAPPLLSTLVRTGRAPDLSPRHLIFALPFWAVLVGAAVAVCVKRAHVALKIGAVAGAAALAVVSPQGISDPRSITYTAALGSDRALAEPAAWLRARVAEDDVLYPYSSVFLAALPEAGRARALPRGQSQSLLAAVGGLGYPVPQLFVAVPSGRTPFGEVAAPGGGEVGRFDSWLVVSRSGPFADEAALLRAVDETLAAVGRVRGTPAPEPLLGWFELNGAVLCESLSTLGAECVGQ